MEIEKVNPIDDPRWFDFICHSSEATAFHHPSWLKVLRDQYRFPTFAVCVSDDQKRIRAGIPVCETVDLLGQKKWISLPFTDHCEILYEDPHEVKNLLDHLLSIYRESGIVNIEIRARIPGRHGFKEYSDVMLHKIPLESDPESVFAGFTGSHARGVRKAFRNNLKAEVMNSKVALDEFYRLHLLTRRKHGVPVQPRRYFDRLYEEIIGEGIGFILSVMEKDRTVASSIFLLFSDTLIYKYGASDPRYLHLRPNNLLFWTAIKEGCSRGCAWLDLGKSDAGQAGLRRFKSGWGAEESVLYYSCYPDVPGEGFFKIIMNNVVSPTIRHSPGIVCRMAGELFYKYFP